MKKKRSKAKKRRIVSAIIIAVIAVTAIVISYILGRSGSDIAHKSSKLANIFANKPDKGKIEVHVIDVGQADCTLIRSSYGNILIDTGTNDSESDLKAHLLACGIKKIDYLICTHPHSDHIGGADMIVNNFDVGTVLLTDAETTDMSFERLLSCIENTGTYTEIPALGDRYALGEIVLTVLGPINPSDDLNNMSLAIKVSFKDTSFLFTGDADEEFEASLVSYHEKDLLDCDFLSVGHHGSASSSSMNFLEAVTPEIAAISCAADNAYGHPRDEVLARLSDAGCKKILRTDIDGTVIVVSDGKKLTVAVG